jgi:uncharacterized protein (DUF1501 family)
MGIWMNAWSGGAQPGGPTGWIGRYLDGLPNAAAESLLGAVLGTSVPLHMVGAVSRASGLPRSISGAFGIDRSDSSDARMYDAISSFGSGPTGLGQWGDMVAKVEHDTLDLSQRIQPAYKGTFPDDDLGQQLVLCARLINANLGIRVLSTAFGGFDTHSDQPGGHAQLLGQLDNAVGAFYAAISPTFRSRVTLMTFSEFGRRPEDNDTSGTDHGTASVQLLIGDRVAGGLHGAQPSTSTGTWCRRSTSARCTPPCSTSGSRPTPSRCSATRSRTSDSSRRAVPAVERRRCRSDRADGGASDSPPRSRSVAMAPDRYRLRLRPWPKNPPRGRAWA